MAEPSPWPASARFDGEGLHVGGVTAKDLAERFETPVLVYDVEEVRRRMRALRDAFPRVAYAVKAFTGHAMLRLAVEEDLDLLCASGGEVQACLRAGVPASRIQLHGNAKTQAELRSAVEDRIALVIADGLDELERLDALAREARRTVDVLLRIRPGVRAPTHEKIATGHEESKFGVGRGEAAAAIAAAAGLEGVRLQGLQAHVGSQVLETEPVVAALEAVVHVAREAAFVPAILDVGGGFGVTYATEPALEPVALARALIERLRTLAAEAGWPEPELRVEPGRWLVANAGCTIYTVLARKEAGGRTLVAVDGGMSDNLRPMLYDAVHAVARASAPPPSAPMRVLTVVGRHCESGDVVAHDVSIPGVVDRGDLLVVAATGAYTYAGASTANRFGRPAVVGVEAGRVTPWLRREDPADMDRLEVVPPSASGPPAPPQDVTIRAATPADARGFLAHWGDVVAESRFLRTERVETTPAQVRKRFKRSWVAEEASVLAVAADGRVVGHIGMARERHPATRHVATLGMAVTASDRRRGIGAALLAEGFRWAREHGVEKLLLSVYPENTAAIALYRRFGFEEEGRLARQSRTSSGVRDEILMAAWIEEVA